METRGKIRILSLLGGVQRADRSRKPGALRKVLSVEDQSPGRFTVG